MKKILHTRFSVMFVVASIAATAFWDSSQVFAQQAIIKSRLDERQYQSFVLPNKLKVLLVSDPSSDKAAASMDVYVGSASNPKDRQGLAHFLEHMLFLGTKKYPKAGEYQEYINSHGGSNNAFTSFHHTNYFFEIDPKFLAPALDRFAQFFVAPLFTEEFVLREKNAVHSEYQTRIKEDGSRTWAARRMVFNPEHPMSRFSIGSLETLADQDNSKIRDELIKLYNQNYSASIMSLVVLGNEPLAVLKQWAVEKFSAVKNIDAKPLSITQPMFAKGQLPAQLNVAPEKDRQYMTLTFPMPALLEYFEFKPTSTISHLLGHEGQGSLLSLLKKKGWADGLSAGAGESNRDQATFAVSINLTRQGIDHIYDITYFVFQYIDLIRKQGVQDWIFEEQKKLAQVSFDFSEKSSAMHYVTSLSSRLQDYPEHLVLYAPYLLSKFRPQLVRKYLDYLRPENMLLTVSHKDVEVDSTEPWFGAQYKVFPIGKEKLARWQQAYTEKALEIAESNPFVPDNLVVGKPKAISAGPNKIESSKGYEFWYQQDTSFKVPRASFYMSFRSPLVKDNLKNSILTELFVGLVNEQLAEYSYPASLAGLEYSLYRHIRGFSIRISGYNDKQGVLLDRILQAIEKPEFDQKRFDIIKDDLLRQLKNSKKDRPYSQTISEVRKLMMPPYWSDDEKIEVLQQLTLDDVRKFVPDLLDRIYLAALSHGNVLPKEADALFAKLKRKVLANTKVAVVDRGKVVVLKDGERFMRNLEVDHTDSAITIYSQGPLRSFATRAMYGLLTQVLASPFYYELRTIRQLGYIVFAMPFSIQEVPGVAFTIQSPGNSGLMLEHSVDEFLGKFQQTLNSMPDSEFAKHKQALIQNILERELRLKSRSNRYWTEIDAKHYEFNSRQKLADAVQQIDKENFIKFYRDQIMDKNTNRLVVKSDGNGKQSEKSGAAQSIVKLIENPGEFSKGKPFFDLETAYQ